MALCLLICFKLCIFLYICSCKTSVVVQYIAFCGLSMLHFMDCAIFLNSRKELYDRAADEKDFHKQCYSLNLHIKLQLQTGHLWIGKCDKLAVMSLVDLTLTLRMIDAVWFD